MKTCPPPQRSLWLPMESMRATFGIVGFLERPITTFSNAHIKKIACS